MMELAIKSQSQRRTYHPLHPQPPPHASRWRQKPFAFLLWLFFFFAFSTTSSFWLSLSEEAQRARATRVDACVYSSLGLCLCVLFQSKWRSVCYY